jgi:hypothetical protein
MTTPSCERDENSEIIVQPVRNIAPLTREEKKSQKGKTLSTSQRKMAINISITA